MVSSEKINSKQYFNHSEITENSFSEESLSDIGTRTILHIKERRKRVRDASIYASKKYRSSFYS